MRRLVRESATASVAGAIAMMPAGLVFRALGMRVGHYGPRFASLYLDGPGPAALCSAPSPGLDFGAAAAHAICGLGHRHRSVHTALPAGRWKRLSNSLLRLA